MKTFGLLWRLIMLFLEIGENVSFSFRSMTLFETSCSYFVATPGSLWYPADEHRVPSLELRTAVSWTYLQVSSLLAKVTASRYRHRCIPDATPSNSSHLVARQLLPNRRHGDLSLVDRNQRISRGNFADRTWFCTMVRFTRHSMAAYSVFMDHLSFHGNE